MKQTFDMKRARASLLGDSTGFSMIDFCLSGDKQQMLANGSLPGSIDSMLQTVVEGLFLGLDQDVKPVLKRAGEWQEFAVKVGHVHTIPAERALFFRNVVLCMWLSENRDEPAAVAETMNCWEAAIRQEIEDERKWDKPSMNAYFRFSISCRQFERAQTFFEQIEPPVKDAGLLPRKWRSERGLAYALCRAQTRGEFNATKLERALQHFLQSNMLIWFSNGWEKHAAEWLKYSYWQREPECRTPAETIRQALNYMKVVAE